MVVHTRVPPPPMNQHEPYVMQQQQQQLSAPYYSGAPQAQQQPPPQQTPPLPQQPQQQPQQQQPQQQQVQPLYQQQQQQPPSTPPQPSHQYVVQQQLPQQPQQPVSHVHTQQPQPPLQPQQPVSQPGLMHAYPQAPQDLHTHAQHQQQHQRHHLAKQPAPQALPHSAYHPQQQQQQQQQAPPPQQQQQPQPPQMHGGPPNIQPPPPPPPQPSPPVRSGGSPIVAPPQNVTPPPVKMYLNVLPSDFGVLVGKSAGTLNSLREKCPNLTKIQVPRAGAASGSKVTLEGQLEDCMKAKSEVEAILMTPITWTIADGDGKTATPTHSKGSFSKRNIDCADSDAGSISSHGSSFAQRSHDVNSELELVESIDRLRQSGALSDEEFTRAKSTLFSNLMQKLASRGKEPAPGSRTISPNVNDNSSDARSSTQSAKRREPPKGLQSLQAGHIAHPDDWLCSACGNMNWATRKSCNRCTKKKATTVKRFVVNVGVNQRMASSCKEGFTPGDGDLTGTGWEPAPSNANPWYCLDAGTSRVVSGVVIKPLKETWVTAFSVVTSTDGGEWKAVDDGAVFQGCCSADASRTAMFLKPVVCRYVKLQPQTWTGANAGLRCALVLCALEGAGKSSSQHSGDTRSRGTDGDREEAKVAAREKLEHFFTRHNPEKLSNIDAILHHCEKSGMEYAQLYRKLEAKYARRQGRGGDSNIVVLNTCTAQVGRFRSDWTRLTVGALKQAISQHFDVPAVMQLLTTRSGLEVDNDSSLCCDHDISGPDCVLFLDHLIHDTHEVVEADDDDIVKIPVA